jgi:hypothetical protein
MVGKAQKSHGERFELNSLLGLEKVDRWNPIRTSVIQSSVVNFTPQPLYPLVKNRCTHWIGGWVGLRADLDAMAKREKESIIGHAGN